MRIAILVLVSLAAAVATAAAQSLPRDGDGHPDLSGIWQVLTPANANIEGQHARPGEPGGQGIVVGGAIPYQPWALEQRAKNAAQRATLDPEAKCYSLGVPRTMYQGLPFQIFQERDMVLVLFEYAHQRRYLYTNGTPHPDGPINWWMGDSRATWEGDTLVVDSVHFMDETWLDRAGNFHGEDLHLVERFTLASADHIAYSATLENPKVFTRPWQIETVLYRRKEKNVQLLEYECYSFPYEQFYPLETR